MDPANVSAAVAPPSESPVPAAAAAPSAPPPPPPSVVPPPPPPALMKQTGGSANLMMASTSGLKLGPNGVPVFVHTHPVLDELIQKLKQLGPDGSVDPNAMIKRVAGYLNNWWESRLSEQVFFTLSFMLERLGGTNQSIEIDSLRSCFSLAMARPSYWSPRQLEMLKHIKTQLDKLSTEAAVSSRPPPPPPIPGASMFPIAPPAPPAPKRSKPTPIIRAPPPPVQRTSQSSAAGAAAAAASPSSSVPLAPNVGSKKVAGNFVELFYSQMDAMNSNLYDVYERMVSLERRFATHEKVLNEITELRRDMAGLRTLLLQARVNASAPAAAGSIPEPMVLPADEGNGKKRPAQDGVEFE